MKVPPRPTTGRSTPWVSLALLAWAGCGGSPTPADAARRDAAQADALASDALASDAADASDATDARGLDATDAHRPDAASPRDGGADGARADAALDANVPGVRFLGRIDRRDPAGPRFQWSGSGVIARFAGRSVAVRLRDSQNEFRVAIDGVERPKLITRAGDVTYPLASGLAAGTHTVELWRRTEAWVGPTQFLGFEFGPDGTLLAPPPAPTRRLEIVGDSITCGYGNEGANASCPFTLGTENNYLAYGSLAARTLGAELHTVAWSGYGMYVGYSGTTSQTIPPLYDRALPTDPSSVYDTTQFVPDAVVINLGTNDYAQSRDPGAAYTTAYVAFVKRLRRLYPRAYILASIGPTTRPRARIEAALSTLRAEGERNVGFLQYSIPSGALGCQGHPNVAGDRAMAAELVTALRAALRW